MKSNRNYCFRCGSNIQHKMVDDTLRDYCSRCKTVFYDNPLPVVSAVVVNTDREVLLVLRDREPQAGKWCLPSGFVEVNESIEEAVIRELMEETGIRGKVVRLLDVVSYNNRFYGDLIWVSFEVQYVEGVIKAGDDARAARYYPILDLPELAFIPNSKALKRYLDYYTDLWKMNDSFKHLSSDRKGDEEFPSDKLFNTITRDAHIITKNWVAEVLTNQTTRHYATFKHEIIYQRAHKVISQFSDWMTSPGDTMAHVWEYYRQTGAMRRKESFKLAEVLSALSLTRKHIFTHVLGQSGIWEKPIDMYVIMEFMSRVNLFFDKAVYHLTLGFEQQDTAA